MPTLTSITNHFITGKEGFTTTTSGSVASGATTVGLNSVSGYTNGDSVAFVIDPTDANKKQVFTGTIDTSGVQVTNVVWTEGTNQTHAAGATVVDYTTATHQAALVKGLLVSHDQDGTLKAGAVDNAAALATDVVETAKIKDLNVTTAKLANGSVTPAKWTNTYCFLATKDAAQNTTSGAYAKQNFKTEVYDYSGDYDAANSKFVCSKVGVYRFNLAASGPGGAIGVCAIYVNGALSARGGGFDASSAGIVPVTADVLLAASDYVEAYVYSTATNSIVATAAFSYFSGSLIHAV